MDNLTQIEHHERFCHPFFISNLTCCKFVALEENILFLTLFKIITVFKPSTLLEMFFMWDQDRVPLMPKILNLTLPLDVTHNRKIESFPSPSCLTPSPPWLQTACWKKVFLIDFRQILSKTLLVVHIFSFIITTYSKNIIWNKSLSRKQRPAELSPWIIPSVSPILPKMYHLLSFCLLLLPCMDCPAYSPKQ